jgi:hypothetical protein
MSSESQGRVRVHLAKKNTSLKYKKLLCPDDIVPSIVPPPSHCPVLGHLADLKEAREVLSAC